MVKIIIFIILAVGGYILYKDGLHPYFNAVNETEKILQNAGIPYEKRNASEYRSKAIQILKDQCKHGYKEAGIYDFRCASDATLTFLQ